MTVATGQAPSDYEAFAPFYDAFTAGSDYEAWAQHVLGLARSLGLRGYKLLDLACGTGNSFLPFLKHGFAVTACDLSPAMLAEAVRKAPEARLVHGDVRQLATLGRFDLVTCFDDSLNYLLEEPDLAAAFGSIAANLSPSGLALFDLNTLLAYRTTFARDSVTVRDGATFVWRGESDGEADAGCRTAAQIDVFAPRDDGLYQRVSSRHAQRHFPRDRVISSAAGAGLECLGAYGVLDDGQLALDADEAEHLKVLYAARRAEGGDAE